ncbi:MAG: hypothetical protein J0L58_17510, partial [Burkholderiales bacterium]|nr:hypothetical protein [Burkholderiales bacterium]
MSDYVIKMPDIGEGIAEVELVAWHVQPGDAVREDQILADVMTDKATVEIPCGTRRGSGHGLARACRSALVRPSCREHRRRIEEAVQHRERR